jgi:hypothetical protein
MNLKYITDRALSTLLRDIETNSEKYSLPEPWTDETTLGTGWCRDTQIELPTLPELTGTRPTDDLESTIAIYSALQKLTPLQATDERLWAYLTHVTYWKYMAGRWGGSPVKDRYFFRSRGLSGLVINGLSRLWWFGRVSHDPTRADPWELTRVLLGSQDIQTGLLQRDMGRSDNVRRAALGFFATRQARIDELGASGTIQRLCLELNVAGGACLLDATPAPVIEDILENSLQVLADRK